MGNLVASLPLNPTVRARALSSFPEFVAGADLAIGPQPCFAAQPPRTYSCARWTDAEKLLLANPRQDALNGGAGSTERLVCSKDRSRAYYYDGTKAPCDCRCCQLEPSKPAAKCISGVGQIGIHPSNPESNFFAVPLEKLALSEVTDALVDGAVKLPKGFASASFPGSVMFSSSSTERRARGLNLLKGTTMGGRMDFLGTEGDAVITIDGATKGFVLDAAAAEPLAVGDVLLLSRSQGNPSAGPSFRIDARGSKVSSPSVSGTGWMSLFSKQAAGPATIAMSSTDELHVTANSQMWGIGASVNVSGWLRQDWTTMPIGASINLSKPDVAAKFSSLVVAKLRELGKRRQFQLTAAQAAVRNKAGQLKAVLKTCNFKACTVPTAERRCLQWMEKRTCPALKVCGQEDPRCIACGYFLRSKGVSLTPR